MDIDDLDVLLPYVRENRTIAPPRNKLERLNEVTEALEQEDITVVDVRFLFNIAVDEFPDTANRLRPTASIILNGDLERVIYKILENCIAEMSDSKLKATSNLTVIPAVLDVENVPCKISVIERALKQRKLNKSLRTRYMNLIFTFPTSNLCQRFFSVAVYASDDGRKSQLPDSVGMQLFFNANPCLWWIEDGKRVINEEYAMEQYVLYLKRNN